MADFNTSFKISSIIEGGYVNDPNDTGGETYRGVSRSNNPYWKGWTIIDGLKKDKSFPYNLALDVELQKWVSSFYKVNFWNALSLDDLLDQKMANELYDTAINMGLGRAGLFFQRVLNTINRQGTLFSDLKLDGQIGSKTIASFNALSVTDKYLVWKLFNCLQGEKYISICEANPSQEKFIRSWASRVF